METLIEVLLPGEGGLPQNGVDGGGSIFTEWDVGDEAQFTVSPPDRHDGGPIGLKLDVSATLLKRHQWRVRLSRSGMLLSEVYQTFNGTGSEFTEAIEIMASSTDLQGGDNLTCSLKRVDAPSEEDTIGVLVYGLRFYAGVSVGPISSCSGRVGKIVDSVLLRFNDPDQRHISQSEIVVFVNDLLMELAQQRVFRRSIWKNVTAGSSNLTMEELGSDVIDVVSMAYQEHEAGHIWNMQAVNQIWDVEKFRSVYGPPRWYHVNGGVIEFAPKANRGGRIGVVAAIECPQASCETGALPTSKAHDQMFVYYCLRECHGRDWTAVGAREQWSRFNGLFEAELAKMLSNTSGNGRYVLGNRSLRHFRG